MFFSLANNDHLCLNKIIMMSSACMVQFSAVSAGVEPRPLGPEFSALTVGPMHQPRYWGDAKKMNTVSICMAGYIVGCCTGRRGS